MARNVTFVVDDQDGTIEYLCPVTKETVTGSFFNNTWTTIASPDCGGGWFSYTFNGTAIRIIASASHPSSNFTVQLDDSPLLVQQGSGFYQSPVLADGEHTIVYAVGDQSISPALDMLTVTAGPSTSLKGRTVIVDDGDKDVQYSGKWSQKPFGSVTFDPSSSPYLNTTHWSNTVGDTISYKFNGSSISVYGVVLNSTTGGNVTTSYTIDGHNPTLLPLPSITTDPSPFSNFFHTELQDGEHTILINVSSITGNQSIGFDFLLYNATSPASSSSSKAHGGHTLSAGAIAGIAIGGFFVLVAIFALLFFAWRRKNKGKNVSVESALPQTDVRDSWKETVGTKKIIETYTPPVLLRDQ